MSMHLKRKDLHLSHKLFLRDKYFQTLNLLLRVFFENLRVKSAFFFISEEKRTFNLLRHTDAHALKPFIYA